MSVVDVNTASLTEIETLPGITAEQARQIVAGRPYQSIVDLQRAGISIDTLRRISPPAIVQPSTARETAPGKSK
jgi:DNA uptake protein ComE-like DNA-binding protein